MRPSKNTVCEEEPMDLHWGSLSSRIRVQGRRSRSEPGGKGTKKSEFQTRSHQPSRNQLIFIGYQQSPSRVLGGLTGVGIKGG